MSERTPSRGRLSTRPTLLLALFTMLTLATTTALLSDGIDDPDEPAEVVFVCLNGVAMSVWATAYFNRLAVEKGLPHRAHARAAIPSFRAVPLRMRFALALDGFRLNGFRPQVIDGSDAANADLVVAIDTELPAETPVPDRVRIERWAGFPPMRERYFPSRHALRERVHGLLDRLASEAAGDGGEARVCPEPLTRNATRQAQLGRFLASSFRSSLECPSSSSS